MCFEMTADWQKFKCKLYIGCGGQLKKFSIYVCCRFTETQSTSNAFYGNHFVHIRMKVLSYIFRVRESTSCTLKSKWREHRFCVHNQMLANDSNFSVVSWSMRKLVVIEWRNVISCYSGCNTIHIVVLSAWQRCRLRLSCMRRRSVYPLSMAIASRHTEIDASLFAIAPYSFYLCVRLLHVIERGFSVSAFSHL